MEGLVYRTTTGGKLMKDTKGASKWVFVLCVAASIISLIGVPMALRDRHFVEAGFWGVTLLACVGAAVEIRRTRLK